MSPLLRSVPLASLFAAVSLAWAPPSAGVPGARTPPSTAPTTTKFDSPFRRTVLARPPFRGQDPFDDVRTVEQLRDLERELVQVAARVRPTVVLLRGDGGEGGSASATAVIISKDGLLATCGHVGRHAGRSVIAELADGTQIRGQTLGQFIAQGVDCGLVQLEADGHDLPVAPLGTTVGLAKGDWVIAMGYTHGPPETQRPALTRVGRVLAASDVELFADAPIDAGDSGGPSFNLRGEVVGLNSRCGRDSWQNVATSIDALKSRMEALRAERDAPEDPNWTLPRLRPAGFPSRGGGAGKRTTERNVPLSELASCAQASMLRVYCDARLVGYAVVVDAAGFAVTKASELEPGTRIAVETAALDQCAAEEVARDAASDVALLRFSIASANAASEVRLEAVDWASDVKVVPGAVVVTPGDFGKNPSLGFAAIERRESEMDMLDSPYLGVQSRPATAEELERAAAERAVTVVRVFPGTSADRAGLEPGTILLTVDDQKLESPEELRRLLRRHEVGDTVRIGTFAEGKETSREVVLGRRGDSNERMRRGNTATPISKRSSGLGPVLAHDTVTEPDQMGTPIVDSQGRVLGMNIARFDRTATHAIPADRMVEICRRLLEQARPAGGPAGD